MQTDNIDTLNVFMCLRNNGDTLVDTFRSLESIETHFTNYSFHYYIFENDSTDNTPELISNFMQNRSGVYKSETLHTPQWTSVKNVSRTSDMAYYRNAMKQLCNSWNDSSYSLIIDSNVSFSISTISDFINILHHDQSVAMATPFGYIHDSPNTYYDTYALKTTAGKRYIPRFIPSVLKVQSAFGGIAMIRSHALKHSIWEPDSHSLESEHVSFCKNISSFGCVVILKHTRVAWIP